MSTGSGYVTWVRDTIGPWGTWLPSNRLSLGDIGIFLPDGTFSVERSSVATLGVVPALEAPEDAGNDVHFSRNYFNIQSGVAATVPNILTLGFKLKRTRKRGHFLQVRSGSNQEIQEMSMNSILDQIKQKLISGDWYLDWGLVGQTLTVQGGTAMVFESRGKGVKMQLASNSPIPNFPEKKDFANAEISIVEADEGVHVYDLSAGATPTFARLWRVRRTLAPQLLGDNPKRIPRHQWRYTEAAGALSRALISNMRPRELFEYDFSFSDL